MEELYKVKSICEQLQATSGKKDKESILQNNADNQLFKDILYFLLNPFIVTGLSEKKINKNVGAFPNVNYTNLLQERGYDKQDIRNLLEYIKKNNTGRDFDISVCESYFTNFESDMQDFIKSILTKSLKLGVDSTANKVYGDGFIPTFDVMLGTSIEKCKIPEGTWFSISHKINGNRCVFVDGEFYTRQGKKHTGLDHIKNDLKKVVINERIVIDGEVVRKNTDGLSDSENFQIGTGLANSKDADKSELKLIIFDMITRTDFEVGKSKLTYKERKAELESLREAITQLGLENVSVVDMFYEGTDQSEIWKWLNYAEEHDLEGVVLNLDAPYECKRTKNLVKVKRFFETDILCTGIENGTGRNKDTLGAIVCDYKGFECKVGSGFSDEQRSFYYNNPNEIVGKIVTVKYKEETKNKNGGVSLQFPVFQIVRCDKSEPNWN